MDDAEKRLRFSQRVTTASEPIRAIRHLPHAGSWLVRASTEYSHAVDDLNASTRIIALAPQLVDMDAAATELFEIAQRLLEIGARFAELSNRIEQRSNEILEDAKAAAEDGRAVIDTPERPVPPRSFLLLLRSHVSESIRALLQRRQRSKAAAPEDAPRRVSRGRAPPSLSASPI